MFWSFHFHLEYNPCWWWDRASGVVILLQFVLETHVIVYEAAKVGRLAWGMFSIYNLCNLGLVSMSMLLGSYAP